MKLFYLSGCLQLTLLGFGFPTHSQEPPPPPPSPLQMNQLVNPDWKLMTQLAGAKWGEDPGIKGTMFYTEDWVKGYVMVKNKGIVPDLSLRFNVYTNEIYFHQDSQILVIDPNERVTEFGFENQEGTLNKITVFRSEYPSFGNNTNKTFYIVLVNGKISLLKKVQKKISDKLNAMSGPEKIFIDSESWYIYDAADNKITEIKKNKNSLFAALPIYRDKMNSIMQDKNVKLKGEDDWIILITELNNSL